MRHGDGYCVRHFSIRSPYSRSEAWKLLPFYCCPPSLAPRFSARSSHTHILPFAGGKKYRRLLSQNVAKIYIDWKICAKGGRDEEYLNILLSLGELLWHAHTNMHAAPHIYLLLGAPFVFASGAKSCRMDNTSRSAHARFLLKQNEVAVTNEYFIKRSIFLRDILYSSNALKRWIFFSNLKCSKDIPRDYCWGCKKSLCLFIELFKRETVT